MPKTSIDEDSDPLARQGDVRCAWQILSVYSIFETLFSQKFTYKQLRRGVLAFYLTHYLGSLCLGDSVHVSSAEGAAVNHLP